MFIRLPIKILKKIRKTKRKRRIPYKRLIEYFAEEFYEEVVLQYLDIESIEQFRSLTEKETSNWRDVLKSLRLEFDTSYSEREGFGIDLSPTCIEKIELIEAVFNCYRQNAVEMILCYGLRIPDKANPNPGELRRTMYDLLVLEARFDLWDLGQIINDAL